MRKVIAFILVTVMLLPVTIPAIGTEQALAASNAQKVIDALEIMKTDKGVVSPEAAKITRAQYAQLLVNMSSLKDTVAVSSNVSLFSDVSRKHWAAGYIKAALSGGWMYGYLDGSFKPDRGVTLIEAIHGVLKLLGYSDSDFGTNAAANKLALYTSKKLNKNITVTKRASYLSYSDCVNLFYNVLNTTTKEGKVYAETLGYSLDTKGELDYLSVINTKTEGPLIAGDHWANSIPFSILTASFYKNDIKSSYTDISKYDVLYYSESAKTVWAYDTKVTGILSAVNPDRINPTSVTVAGAAYPFESSTASLEFSSVGTISKGEIITLLLGKNKTVAGVLTQEEYSTAITGLVMSVGVHGVENKQGIYENTNYVTFVDAAGNTYTQDYDSDALTFYEEDIIRVIYEGGKVTVSKYDKSRISLNEGTFSSDGTSVGGKKLAADVKILDYSSGRYTSLYPIRLANAILLDSRLHYYDTNANGEIKNLILDNATGDLDSYGIFTGFSYTGGSGTYNYIIDGAAGKVSKSSYSNFSITEGPTGFRYEDGGISASYALQELPVEVITTTTITSKSTKYQMAEKLGVYYLSGGEYVATTLDKIKDLSKYQVKAYCDKAVTLGGRIRMIVAESKTN